MKQTLVIWKKYAPLTVVVIASSFLATLFQFMLSTLSSGDNNSNGQYSIAQLTLQEVQTRIIPIARPREDAPGEPLDVQKRRELAENGFAVDETIAKLPSSFELAAQQLVWTHTPSNSAFASAVDEAAPFKTNIPSVARILDCPGNIVANVCVIGANTPNGPALTISLHSINSRQNRMEFVLGSNDEGSRVEYPDSPFVRIDFQ